MKLKVFSLLIVLLLACGCESWDDFYNEHKGILDEGISCEYFYINQSEEAEPITNIKNIKLNGNNEEISVSYDAGENMVLINSDNYYTPYHEIVKLRDKVRLYYNKFDYNTYIENYEYIHDEISSFASENGIAYLDYNMVNQEMHLLTNENFRDDAHLNDSGVKIVDAHFLNWLRQNSKTFASN